MTQITRLSGIGNTGLQTTPFSIDPNMSKAQLDLLLMRERLELEQQISRRLAGVGTTLDNTYQYDLRLVNEALANLHQPQKIAGIGAAIGKTIVGKFLQKVGNEIKTGAKAVADTVTAPIKLAAKGILELTLPKSAPAFLYLFLKPEQLDLIPDSVRNKRKAAEVQAKFIVQGLGMKEDHFMGIVRNGIMKQLGRTPEQELELRMKGYTKPAATSSNTSTNKGILKNGATIELGPEALDQGRPGEYHVLINGQKEGVVKSFTVTNGIAYGLTSANTWYRNDGGGWVLTTAPVSGIGVVPVAIVTAAVGAVVEIIKKIISLLGKKPERDFTEADAPSDDDFNMDDYASQLAQDATGYFKQESSLVQVPGTNSLVKVTTTKPTSTSLTTAYARQSFADSSTGQSTDGSTNGGSSFNLNSPIVLGGLGLLAFIFLKNK